MTECLENKYGLNCSKTCGNCRGSSQCHHINGSCLNGCDPGFQGEKCNMGKCCSIKIVINNFGNGIITLAFHHFMFVECDFGFYGIGCLQECGSFCKRSRDCHHITGFCTNGCKSGWQGSGCFEGIDILFGLRCKSIWTLLRF